MLTFVVVFPAVLRSELAQHIRELFQLGARAFLDATSGFVDETEKNCVNE
jgi:hypothetical protein